MRTLDLFCGCGGMSLGFQQAGFELIAAYDNWLPAVQVYRQNFSHPAYCVDLGTRDVVDQLQQLAPEMIIGGPPCQDFSSAGKRDENLGRADLTYVFADLVAQIRPQWFVMENVERVGQSQTLKRAKARLQEVGYGLSETILNASLCGVPQNRKRFFMIGELNGLAHSLNTVYLHHQATQPMTVYDYLGDSLGIEYYYRHPRSYKRRAIFSIYEPSPTIRGVNRPIPPTYQNHPGDAAPLTPDLRELTTRERSYIQTFPADFIFTGSKSDMEQMIGNAVPVKLAEFIAQGILAHQQHSHSVPLQIPLW